MPAAARPVTPAPASRTPRGWAAVLALEVAVRYVLCAQHLVRSRRRHRSMERSRFRHRVVEGHLARRPALLSGVSVHVLPTHRARRCARPVRLPSRPCPPSPAKRRHIRCRFRSAGAVCSVDGNSCFSTASRFDPIRRNRRNGTVVPIWSTDPATAPSATARAMFLGGIESGKRFAGRAGYRGQGLGSQHHPEGTCRLFRERHRLPARDRADAGRGLGRRTP